MWAASTFAANSSSDATFIKHFPRGAVDYLSARRPNLDLPDATLSRFRLPGILETPWPLRRGQPSNTPRCPPAAWTWSAVG